MAILNRHIRNSGDKIYSVPDSRTGTNVAPSGGQGNIYTVPPPPASTPIAPYGGGGINPVQPQYGIAQHPQSQYGVNTLAGLMALRNPGINMSSPQYGIALPQPQPQYGINMQQPQHSPQYGINTGNNVPPGSIRPNPIVEPTSPMWNAPNPSQGYYGINSMPGTLSNTLYQGGGGQYGINASPNQYGIKF